MPRPARRSRDRRPGISPLQWATLNDAPPPEAADLADAFFPDADELPLAEAWRLYRAEILVEWTAAHPGTRPRCWWQFEALEPRRRLGGVGDRLSEVLAHGPFLSFGIPGEGWLTASLAAVYRTHLNITLRNRVAGRAAQPVDSAYPPRYESQTAYLHRLGLLTPAELRLLADGELSTEPELTRSDGDEETP